MIQTEKGADDDGLAAWPGKTSQGRIRNFHGPVLRDLRQNALMPCQHGKSWLVTVGQ